MSLAATALPRFCRPAGIVASLLFVAAQVGGQTSGVLEFVCLSSDGSVLPLSASATGDPDEDWRELSTFTDAEVEACWVWTELCPPVRRPFGSDLAPDCGAGSASAARTAGGAPAEVVVRLSALEDEEAPADPPTLTAAPSAMWREVPRGLLPNRSVDADVVRLPHGPGPWRLQACAERRCSRWTDVPDGTDEISLPLLQAHTASYRVATTDGSPLVNARFHLVRPGRGGLSRTEILGFEQPDQEGRVVFRLPLEQVPPVVVSSDGREAVAYLALHDVPARVELGPGLVLSGRVVNAVGEPVAAELRGHSFIRDGFGLTQMQRGRTGPAGRFLLAGFSPGDATLRAVAEAEDGREFASRLKLVESLDLGDIVLTEVEVVWVRVIDSVLRSPVNGAVVRTADAEWRSGTDGLAGLELRYSRELQILAPGYGFAAPRLPAGVGHAPTEPFPIELEPALTVTGIYVAADGLTPAANGRFSARGGKNLGLSGAIRQDGAFSVDLPGGGAWVLDLVAGNAGSVRLEVEGGGGETIDLGVVLAPPSAAVFGHVVGESYEALAGVTVSSTLPSEAGPLLSPVLGGTLTATSGPDGYFELHGLEAGPTAVRFVAEGYAPHRLELQVEGATPVDVGTVELSRGKRIVVRSDAMSGLVEMEVGDAAPPEKMTAALVDREAVFLEVPDGPIGIVVLNGDRQPVCTREVPEPKNGQAIRCDDRSVGVTGRVTMGGAPVAGTLLWQRRDGGAAFPGGLFRSRTDGLERVDRVLGNRIPSLRVTLDGDGMYRLDSVLPGEWDVIWRPGAGGAQEPRLVGVPAGAADEVVRDISYEGVSVEGIVLNPEGSPVGRATVEVFPDQPPVVTDGGGNFRVLGLRPGRYQLRAREGHLRSDLVDVELDRPGDRETVQLHLGNDPAQDRLRIELADGSDGFCLAEMDRGVGQLVQVRNGMAEVRVEPPLGEQVRVGCNTGGRWVLGGWRSLREAMERGLEFDPGASTASLALIGPSGVDGITISGPGGWNLGTLRMWFGGGPTFTAGETITNLPVGAYVIGWAGGSRSVFTERRRVTEVELDD